MAGNLYDRLNIAVRHWLLKPGGVVGLQPFPDTNGIGNTDAGMSFARQIYFRPYGFPYGGHDLDRKILFAPGKGSLLGTERIKLERRISQLHSLTSGVGKSLGGARTTVPSIGIS